MCINTETGIFSRKNFNKFSMYCVYFFKIIIEYSFFQKCFSCFIHTLLARSWCYSKYVRVYGVCVIFANIADAKSKQNTWILLFIDFFTKCITQSNMFYSTSTGITLSFIEHFCNIAKQKRCVTLPFSYSFNICFKNLRHFSTKTMMDTLIIFSITTYFPPNVRYSTPRNVELTTLTKLVIACFKLWLLNSSIWMMKSNFSLASMLKMSFRISS